MALKTIRFTKEEMNSRVARFDQLQGFDGGLPDSKHPDSIRTLFNVIGFQPPENDDLLQLLQLDRKQQRQQLLKYQKDLTLDIAKQSPERAQ